MSKQLRLLTLVAMLAPIVAQAGQVTLEQAQAHARRVMAQELAARGHRSAAVSPRLAYAPMSREGGQTDFYVFNNGEDGGFAIISGDDNAIPLLAYSDHGSFDPENMPCNLQWWLEVYRQEMQTIREHPEFARSSMPGEMAVVAPLVASQWNQNAPYNNMCPAYTSDTRTLRALTGCVATAAAQIMRYHQWPAQGRGSHTYECHVNGEATATTLSADFSGHTYEWGSMPDKCTDNSTEAQKNAVSQLLSDVGISVQMGYGASSWAFNYMAANSLFKHFGYDPRMQYIQKSQFGDDEWDKILYRELECDRPVFYTGRSDDSGGHAFIIDGNDASGKFHINWGWGGFCDGYFLLSLLKPDAYDDFTDDQWAIVNLHPNRYREYPDVVGTCFEFVPLDESVPLGGTAHFNVSHATVRGELSCPELRWGFAITNVAETDTLYRYNTYYYQMDGDDAAYSYYWALIWNMNGMYCDLPNNLPDGRYHVKLLWSSDLWQTQQAYVLPDGKNDHIDMTVVGGTAYFGDFAVSGDITGDGHVDIADVNMVLNVMLGKASGDADVNHDNKVDIGDVNTVINLMLGK